MWGRLLAMVLGGLPSVGLDAAAIRREFSLEPVALNNPDGRFPLATLYGMIERIVEQTGDELVMLALGREVDPSTMDALGFLALTCPTLDAALDATIRYQRVFAEGERYCIERTKDLTLVRYEPWGPSRPAHVAWADMFARDLGVNMPNLVGAPLDGVRVRLRRAPPKDPDRFHQLLGVEAQFRAPCDEIAIPNTTLATPIPRADPMLARFFARYLDERIAQLPAESVVGRAAACIEELLPGGSAELEAVASKMRLSPRTLQRRLADAGVSFTDLIEQTRRAKAMALLDADVAIAEVAWLLGYSEPSALHRAFTRWTGTTPKNWRAGHSSSETH